jgi:hypothetical protein
MQNSYVPQDRLAPDTIKALNHRALVGGFKLISTDDTSGHKAARVASNHINKTAMSRVMSDLFRRLKDIKPKCSHLYEDNDNSTLTHVPIDIEEPEPNIMFNTATAKFDATKKVNNKDKRNGEWIAVSAIYNNLTDKKPTGTAIKALYENAGLAETNRLPRARIDYLDQAE